MKALSNHIKKIVITISGIVTFFCFVPDIVTAHCDTIEGPVVKEARVALEKGDITPVLKWVKKENEGEIVDAFKKTLTVRKESKEAKDLADMYFFETLVRIHREGEGAPYTGLKSGDTVEPIIIESDRALESGSVDDLVNHVNNAVGKGIREKFAHTAETKKNADKSVEAGREYVEAYVVFTHYVERLYNNAVADVEHHEERKETEKKEHTEHH